MSSWIKESTDFDNINKVAGKLLNNVNTLVGSSDPGSLYQSQASRNNNEGTYPTGRGGANTRQMVKWFIPERPVITMYVNPESIGHTFKKIVPRTRTKGGYTVQYLGEDLESLSISGTTASSGIEGLQVLESVYRNEQIVFDNYALEAAAKVYSKKEEQFEDMVFSTSSSKKTNVINMIDDYLDISNNSNQLSNLKGNPRNLPTLASLAFTVEMYYFGEVRRGYFESFTFNQKANQLGLFDYAMTFICTQRRGSRQNFMPWHRSPNEPSNSSRTDNYSFGYKLDPLAPSEQQTRVRSLVDAFDVF